jgi:hypothetical protein
LLAKSGFGGLNNKTCNRKTFCTQHAHANIMCVCTRMGLSMGLATSIDKDVHEKCVVARNMCTCVICVVAHYMCTCTTCVVARNMCKSKVHVRVKMVTQHVQVCTSKRCSPLTWPF